MFLIRRLTPAIVSLLTAASLISFVFRPSFLLALFGGNLATLAGMASGLCLFALSLGMLNIGAYHPLTSRFRFLLFPLIFVVSTFVSVSFLEPRLTALLIIALCSGLLWLWYESLYTYWQQPERYHAYTLQKLSGSLYVIGVFFVITAVNGIYVYLQMRFWGGVILVLTALFALFYDIFLLCQFERTEALIAASAASFLAAEAYIAMSYMPTQIYVEALLMAVVFYGLVGVTKLWSQEDFRRSQWLPYAIVAASCFVLTLGSSLWIF